MLLNLWRRLGIFVLEQELERKRNFSVKGQIVSILVFMGHVVSVAAIQLCPCGKKVAYPRQYVNEWTDIPVYVPVKLYLQKQAESTWPLGPSLLAPVVEPIEKPYFHFYVLKDTIFIYWIGALRSLLLDYFQK